MSEYVRKFKEKHVVQAQKETGAVAAQCEKLGCPQNFVKSFITRAELFPMKQTLAFLENKGVNAENLERWNVLLSVLIEQNSKSEKQAEWKRCIKALKNER